MSPLLRLTAVETKLFFREPVVAFFALAFPPLLIVILGLVPDMGEPVPELGGMTALGMYVPVVVAMGVALFALNGLAQLFAAYREKGVLRRMRTTPVRPATMIGAQLLMGTALSLLTMAVVLAVARLAFGVGLPRQLPAYLLGYLLTALSLFAIGLLVGALAPTGKSAAGAGTLVFFPLVFFAGLWVPRAAMNDVLLTISDWSPLGAGVQSLHDAAAGQWPQPLHLAVMLGWTVVAGGLAARFFRWE